MAYALFAQEKITLTGQLNAISLQQTQRSNEQYNLATSSLSLQQKMSSLQSAQSLELADLYELLSNSTADGLSDNFLDSFSSSGNSEGTTRNLSEYSSEAKKLISAALRGNSPDRESINAAIKKQESLYDAELDEINREIYLVGIKENSVEMQVKRLDTQYSSVDQRLDKVIDAEGDAIERSTPNFGGK